MNRSHVTRTLRMMLATAAALTCCGLGFTGPACAMGDNGGVRLLLHVDDQFIPASGAVETDPCEHKPGITSPEDLVVNVTGDQDTVWAWVYLYHPLELVAKGFGFGIQLDGVNVISSGTCADIYFQDTETMGPWAESGSEIAYAWGGDKHISGNFEPVAWFLLERLDRDGFFALYKGGSQMSGAVGDTNHPPSLDEIWDYGSIGFGEVSGELPIPNPNQLPDSWGTIRVGIE